MSYTSTIKLFRGCKALTLSSLKVPWNSQYWFAPFHKSLLQWNMRLTSENSHSSLSSYSYLDIFSFFFPQIWFINNGLIQVFSAINPHYITWNYISYGRCSEASFTVPLLNVTKKYIVIFKGTSFNRLFTFSCSQKNARKYSSSFKKYSMRSLEPNCTNIQQLSIQKLKPETVFH